MIDYLPVQGRKVLFGKPGTPVSGKERNIRVGDCGVERQLFATQVFFFCRFIGLERRVLTWQCVVRVGEVLFVRFTVNGRSNQLSGFCGWPCGGSGGNGRKVPQTKDYPVSYGKAPKEENNGLKNG